MITINRSLNIGSQEPLETLCIFPVIQQVVGVSGAIYHFAKLMSNLAKRAFYEIKYDFEADKGIWKLASCSVELFVFRLVNDYKRDKHLSHLALNILRAIPVVGTAISIERSLTYS